MSLIRFEDENDNVYFGVEWDNQEAEVLARDPLLGIERTGDMRRIKKRLAPISPTNIYGIGLNYKRHAEETGLALPKHPVVFMKATSSVIGPNEPIALPKCQLNGPEVDYEAELAIIIGRPAKDVAEADALQYVLGYTAANDVSARRWQKSGGGGQWVRGKTFDTFCPLGPRIVTSAEIDDPQDLSIAARINGETLQQSSTKDMIFPIKALISRLSQDTTLMPGTVILTGTPEGVGFVRNPPRFLKNGDEVTIEIEGIGALTNPVEDA